MVILSVDQATPVEYSEAVSNAEENLTLDPPGEAGEGDKASSEDVKVFPTAKGDVLPAPVIKGWRKGS